MPQGLNFSRINLSKITSRIEMEVGRPKSEKYLCHLRRFMYYEISALEFSKLASDILGRENLYLHNRLLISMLKNATLSKSPPPKVSRVEASLSVRVPSGYQRSSLQSLCKDFPQSPRRGRTPNLRDRKYKDRPSPLGPHGKTHGGEDIVSKFQEQQSATELLSLGGRPPGSEEDGEEVEQAAGSPGVYSRSPVRAPLGIHVNTKASRKRKLSDVLASTHYFDTCNSCGELPDTSSLKKRLEHRLEMEGLKMSVDCANLLNNSIDVFLKRLIKPCLQLARTRSGCKHADPIHGRNIPGLNGMWPVRNVQKPTNPVSVSVLDFRVAMELNPFILGEDWPTQLEKICLLALKE